MPVSQRTCEHDFEGFLTCCGLADRRKSRHNPQRSIDVLQPQQIQGTKTRRTAGDRVCLARRRETGSWASTATLSTTKSTPSCACAQLAERFVPQLPRHACQHAFRFVNKRPRLQLSFRTPVDFLLCWESQAPIWCPWLVQEVLASWATARNCMIMELEDSSALLSPDRTLLAAASSDGGIRIVDAGQSLFGDPR